MSLPEPTSTDLHGAPRPALLVLGRGGLGAAVVADMRQLCDQLAQRFPTHTVAHAFVDRQAPPLPQALDALQDAPHITILPTFLPDEVSLRRWLHKVAMRWLAASRYPGSLQFLPPLGTSEHLVNALALHAQHSEAIDIRQAMQEEPWEHDPAAWSDVPTEPYQVLWCVGPRCAAKGALALWPKLGEIVRGDPQLKNQFHLLQTSCQYPCNRGPLMQIHPGGKFYGPLESPADIAAQLHARIAPPSGD